MRFCSTQIQPVLAASKSDPFKSYEVILKPVDSKYPKCTCIAFAMARNRARKGLEVTNVDVEASCKHIKSVLATACTWSGGEDLLCPECLSETIEEGSSITLIPIPIESGPTLTTGMPELRPMLATEVAAEKMNTYINDSNWYAEQKVDGHRVLIHVQAGKLMVLGRGGQASQHASRFSQPHYKDILRLSDCVIDGELIGDIFWIFDLPHHGGEKITVESSYIDRREILESLFDTWKPNEAYKLLPVAKTQVEKALLATTCYSTGGEGLMFKEVNGTYSPGGRTKTMLKAKFVKDADVIVTDIGTSGKTNYTLSVFKDGDMVEVGKCSAIGKSVVTIGSVIEVKYLYLGVNEKLYQPRMIKERTDKLPYECLWSQFDHARVNKEVIA